MGKSITQLLSEFDDREVYVTEDEPHWFHWVWKEKVHHDPPDEDLHFYQYFFGRFIKSDIEPDTQLSRHMRTIQEKEFNQSIKKARAEPVKIRDLPQRETLIKLFMVQTDERIDALFEAAKGIPKPADPVTPPGDRFSDLDDE